MMIISQDEYNIDFDSVNTMHTWVR